MQSRLFFVHDTRTLHDKFLRGLDMPAVKPREAYIVKASTGKSMSLELPGLGDTRYRRWLVDYQADNPIDGSSSA